MQNAMNVQPSGVIPTSTGGGNGDDGTKRYRLATHQQRILKEMDDRGILGIFAEAGTGKTIIALTWVYEHLMDGTIEDALVICPASLVDSWNLAIDRLTEFEGFVDTDVEIMHKAVKVTSYGKVWESYEKITRHHNGTMSRERKHRLRADVDRHWGCIIIDESHGLGSHRSLQTAFCLELSSHAPYRFVMTGTPDSGKYEKLYGQIRFLHPSRWKNYSEFKHEVVRTEDQYHNPRTYYTDTAEALKRQYGTVARLRECYDMPEYTDVDVPVHIGDSKVYRDMLMGNCEQYGVSVSASGVVHNKAIQVCSGFVKTDNGILDFKNNKLDALATIIQSREDKVVVFAQYTHSIDLICAMLAKMKVKHYRFDGSVSEPVWQKFQKDDSRVIVVQYQRGGAGLDLFAANCMVLYEVAPVQLLTQAKARIMRKGQTRNCTYYFIYCQGTIEERVMRSFRAGVDVSNEMLDQWAKELSE